MDQETEQSSAAEQRAFAVAKLKRAASLPRMKDGRRPPMHVEAVSEGERARSDEDKKADESTPPPEPEDTVELTEEVSEDVIEEPPRSPEPVIRSSKRRSRSRSRRGSKDLRAKARATQSPTPNATTTGDSSPDEEPPPPPPIQIPIPVIPPVLQPIPSRFPRSRLLMSPSPISPEPMFYPGYPGTSPSTPIPLPTLEALQKGLFRSNSAGSVSAGRRMAMHKLTGGKEAYDASPSYSPPPLPGQLGRNNTVSGGERSAARQNMLSRLGGRITRETDGEPTSGGEDFSAPSPPPKRRRRRSKRSSAGVNTAPSDSEFLSTSPNTPIVPHTPLPLTLDVVPDFRAASATPSHAASPLHQTFELERATASPAVSVGGDDRDRPEQQRRRSVVVEEEEEEDSPLQSAHTGLPATPKRSPGPIAASRVPHGSDAPSQFSTGSASPSAVPVPIYLSATQRTPSRQELFPSSPFATPSNEKLPRDEDEEQVLYPAETHRPRTPYEDHFDREISWVATPVPEIRMPVDEEEEEEEEEEDYNEEEEFDDPPLSAHSSSGFAPRDSYDDASPRVSSDSKDIVIEETSPETTPSFIPPSPSSVAALSHTASITRASDDSMSPQLYPTRLSVASRMQSDRSPLNVDSGEWDDRAPTDSISKRSGDAASTSTWEKVKNTFLRSNSSTGRRSRTNSVVTRDRRDHTDSSVSRESGMSLTSPKTDKGDSSSTFVHQQVQQPLMQSPSASASMLSLAPHSTPRSGVSPVPPASSADLAKYQDAKLFPFPGMKKLEEQRNRAKGLLSASSPDVTLASNGDDDRSLHVSSSSSNEPVQISNSPRERKLSHQASDTRLLQKFNLNSPPMSASPSTSSYTEYFNITPQPPQTGSKLPTTLPGVKQWLVKNNRKIFSSQTPPPLSPTPTSPPIVELRSPSNMIKKPSLSDLFRTRKDTDLADWEEINSEKSRTPTSASGSTLLHQLPPSEAHDNVANGSSQMQNDHTDTEKTPKAKRTMAPLEVDETPEISYLHFGSATALPSPPDPLSSATPDPMSSVDDYPPHSTSESSSNTSSDYSQHLDNNIHSQGAFVLERLEENLSRGSRSPMWAAAIDEPLRKLLLTSPVLQVVNSNTVKDRSLFLFSDLLVICKPVMQDQDLNYKPATLDRKSIADRKYIVKSVVLLSQLRFSSDRLEPQSKASTYTTTPRNPLVRAFVHQFPKDPDQAISTLFDKAGILDSPSVLGLILFKALDLDRARLGDYLSRRTSKVVLKAYIDSFGFTGMRVDQALRVFLYSLNIPPRSGHGHNPLEYLLDAFASRWYDANAGIVAYDKDLAIRLVRALVQLNELFHGGIAQEPGPTGTPKRNVAKRDFLDAFRRYDVRYLVSDELLEEVYDSVREERLAQARNPSASIPNISVLIKRPPPARLTYKVQSDPIILRIPQADPQLRIQLYGQGLAFDPPVLNFSKSAEVSFRIMGVSLGPKTMIMCRSGPNASKYVGLPLSNSLIIERAFMRNTFQVAFSNHRGVKRRYMFSVDDPLIHHQWSVYLSRGIEKARSSTTVPLSTLSPGAKFHRAAEHMAFKVLQETLIGPEASSSLPPSALDKALHRLTSPSRHVANGNTPRIQAERALVVNERDRFNGSRTTSSHVRSKSRSQVYHRHGAGKNELDLGYSELDQQNFRNGYDDGKDDDAVDENEQSSRVEGRMWTFHDLEMQCQQNSSIGLVLSYLQVGAPDHTPQGSS